MIEISVQGKEVTIMLIHEAVKKSLETGNSIYREEWGDSFRGVVILPTNGIDCCIPRLIADGNEVSRGRCWNPKAGDLMANDWVLEGQ